MFLQSFAASILLLSGQPVSAAHGATDANACITVDETEPNEFAERFHRIRNGCASDVVVFYCLVMPARVDASAVTGTCRRAKRSQLAAFPVVFRDIGFGHLPAPDSRRTAIKSSKGWLEGFAEHPNPFRKTERSPESLLAEFGSSPAALFIIKAGDEFISGAVSSSPYFSGSALVPSACFAEAYLEGDCEPDSFAAWKRIGSPDSTTGAIDAVRRQVGAEP